MKTLLKRTVVLLTLIMMFTTLTQPGLFASADSKDDSELYEKQLSFTFKLEKAVIKNHFHEVAKTMGQMGDELFAYDDLDVRFKLDDEGTGIAAIAVLPLKPPFTGWYLNMNDKTTIVVMKQLKEFFSHSDLKNEWMFRVIIADEDGDRFLLDDEKVTDLLTKKEYKYPSDLEQEVYTSAVKSLQGLVDLNKKQNSLVDINVDEFNVIVHHVDRLGIDMIAYIFNLNTCLPSKPDDKLLEDIAVCWKYMDSIYTDYPNVTIFLYEDEPLYIAKLNSVFDVKDDTEYPLPEVSIGFEER